MSYIQYPTIDINFLTTQIIKSGTIDRIFIIGNAHHFVEYGNQPLYKRSIVLSETEPGQANLNQATAAALGHLMTWLEVNRNWKEGAYHITANNPAS